MELVVTGSYQAVWGRAVRKKSGQCGAKWVNNNRFSGVPLCSTDAVKEPDQAFGQDVEPTLQHSRDGESSETLVHCLFHWPAALGADRCESWPPQSLEP